MDKDLSNKLTFFSFWLTVLVVTLHSLNIEFFVSDDFFCYTMYLISHKICQIAVPFFFFISGYLYYLKTELNEKIDLNFYFQNNIKRIQTILIPYIVWSLVWYLIVYFLQLLPYIKKYFPNPLYSLTVKEQILNLFYYPLNYPFWFLRILMLLFVITPLIFLSVKYLKNSFIVLIICLPFFWHSPLDLRGITILMPIPFSFFSLGAFFSLNRIKVVFNPAKYLIILCLALWIVFNIISLIIDKVVITDSTICTFLDKFSSILFLKDYIGCYAVWCLYDWLSSKNKFKSYNYYCYSFFIFAFHGIPTLFLVKLSSLVFYGKTIFLFISYLLIVFFIVLLSLKLAKLIEKYFPNIYMLLVGYRINITNKLSN